MEQAQCSCTERDATTIMSNHVTLGEEYVCRAGHLVFCMKHREISNRENDFLEEWWVAVMAAVPKRKRSVGGYYRRVHMY